ncbi:MAG TPA: hypothetical protein VGR00_04660 [Thermoanaerobaculia bacterium]|nr:hypothetical protein [Thermoanaerobaculia bacterium]
MRKERGASLLAALAVMVFLFLMLEVAFKLLTAHLDESRRRYERRTIAALEKSGVDWAKACLAAHRGSCDTTLKLEGGEVDVRVEVATVGYRIHSKARLKGSPTRSAAEREAAALYEPPDKPVNGEGIVSLVPPELLTPEEKPPEPTPGPNPPWIENLDPTQRPPVR